jgi:TolA-binding protein
MRWEMTKGRLAPALLALATGCGSTQPAQPAAPAEPFTTVVVEDGGEPEPDEEQPALEEDGSALVQAEPGEETQEEVTVDAPLEPAQQPSSSLPAVTLGRLVTPPSSSGSGLGSRVRDDRTVRHRPRTMALLRAEAQGLERLFQATPLRNPDRPQLLRRLAETYVEVAAAATIASPRQEQAARQRAIQYYALFKTQYPSQTTIDDVLYYLALAFERAGALGEARKAYYELIMKAPKSAKIPLAYLAFGEMFFEEAKADPSKWALAQAAHGEVVKYPPPQNRAACFARLRLGQIFEQTGNRPKALAEFQKARQCALNHPSLPESADVARAARGAQIRP